MKKMLEVTNIVWHKTVWLTTEDGSKYDLFIEDEVGQEPVLKLVKREEKIASEKDPK